ncbi:hypothetical protein SAMN05880582_101137 [Rhizobium sp. RU20A]|uniref:DUF6163 family protein n=1 Tax=Rhizobium sp. RU20A TaxID=1907412 RepID=UPI000954156E|nr:DUF6163 family protein [Rhizobium sp. RU20A]SIP95086.1 hypothetical protein SAMN05880582_101137 [Rhizobium sp. RU20A]
MFPDSAQVPKPSLTDILFGVFLRMVALSAFWYGLTYWAMLIGYSFEGQGRFDLLPVPWRAAASALAVIFPVAAVGLWLLVSWGPVIWLLGAAVELTMFEFYPAVFGTQPLLLAAHGAVVFTFLAFQAAFAWGRYKKARDARVHSP